MQVLDITQVNLRRMEETENVTRHPYAENNGDGTGTLLRSSVWAASPSFQAPSFITRLPSPKVTIKITAGFSRRQAF
jgi:hypothetical protein